MMFTTYYGYNKGIQIESDTKIDNEKNVNCLKTLFFMLLLSVF